MGWLINTLGFVGAVYVCVCFVLPLAHSYVFASNRWVPILAYAHACLAVVSLALIFFFYQSIGLPPLFVSSMWLYFYREERRTWLRDMAYLYRNRERPSFAEKNADFLALGMSLLLLSVGYYLLALIGILFG